MFAFCSAGAAALYAFGRRHSPGEARFAAVPALVAQPVSSPSPRGYETVDEPRDEEGVPRWLRASVRADRFWTPPRDPDRDLRARGPADAFVEAPADAATVVVRSDATILDGPNESYAAIVGRVHAGDEVLVSFMAEDWAEVRTPRGASGWLPSMALTPQHSDPPAVASEEQPALKSGPRRRAKRSSKGAAPKAG
jgi:hypothetical protein